MYWVDLQNRKLLQVCILYRARVVSYIIGYKGAQQACMYLAKSSEWKAELFSGTQACGSWM
jgi:hypothetical protein